MEKTPEFSSESHINAANPADLPLLYALALHDAPLSRPVMQEILTLAIKRNLTLRSAAFSIYDQLTLLCQRGVVVKTSDGVDLYGVSLPVQMGVLLSLQKSGKVAQWVGVLREAFTARRDYETWARLNTAFFRREFLFSVLIGEQRESLHWRQRYLNSTRLDADRPGSVFFKHEDGIRLFKLLAESEQITILTDVFFATEWALNDTHAAWEAALALGTVGQDDRRYLRALCWQAWLRGEFTRLAHWQALLARLPAPSHVEACGAESGIAIAMALQHGQYALAIGMIDAEQKNLKKRTGQRCRFVPDLPGLLYSVALLAQADEGSFKRAGLQIDEGVKTDFSASYGLLQTLLSRLQHLPAHSVTHSAQSTAPNVDTLFLGLAQYWLGEPPPNALCAALLQLRQNCWQAHLFNMVAELDVLLQRHHNSAPLLPNWHAQNQLRPLADALQPEPGWQRALTALLQMKADSGAQAGSNARIAWTLNFEQGRAVLQALEQKRSGADAWTCGRPVMLKRLALESARIVSLSEQDKRIAACIHELPNNNGSRDYVLDADNALAQLIGHPHVYWQDAQNIRIDIVKGEFELHLTSLNQDITLQLEPAPKPDAPVVWRKQTTTRLAVYVINPEIRQIASILGSGITVPAQAKAQLVEAIAAIAPHMAIVSDLPELAEHVLSIPADTRLYAHLLPLAQGLRMQLLVRPLGDGAWAVPGRGSAHMLGQRDGEAVQAVRQLADEARHLQALVDACPSLLVAEHDGQEWTLVQPEACLELLSELKALPEERLQLVWPEGERFRIRGNRSAGQMRLGIKQQGAWFVAEGAITLDDGRVLALRELLQLAGQAAGRFLKLGENDYLALSERLRKQLAQLNAYADISSAHGVRINALAAPTLIELTHEVGELQADSAWRAQVAKLDSLASFSPELPGTLQATLRDYQLEGYQWLARLARWGVGACLADDMGLGKTVQALALLLGRAAQGAALVVAPVSVAMNWHSEITRFAPTLRVRVYQRERNLDDLGPFDIVIASYGLLQTEAAAFAAIHWHSVVLDEAQVIKNAATKRSQAAMALHADFKMIASGTPVENHLGELWNLFRFINPGLLGSKERFAERFANPIERGDKQARNHLKKLIQPFILRRTKAEVLSELPPRTEITLQVNLSSEERHLYEALRQQALVNIETMKAGPDSASMQILVEITRLRRFCCNPRLVVKTSNLVASKLTVLADTVEELLENRHKALVFSQFVDHLAIVREWLEQKGIQYQYLDGATPPVERKKRVDAFQAGEGDIFLISLKAGGTGLNLTAADYVIHLDPWWNPAVEDQASDRAHRMGQTRPVTIYRLVTADTIEEKIIALHAEKRDLADSLLGGGEASGKLDTAALLRLLKESAA